VRAVPTLVTLALTVAVAGCVKQKQSPASPALVIANDIEARAAQFMRQPVGVDVVALPPGERSALDHLVVAAHIIDAVFLRQAWDGNPEFAARVAALSGPTAQAANDYYRIMAGPWDRLKGFEPFLGSSPHPKGAGFYPEDLKSGELDGWLEAHPEDRAAFVSATTVIRRRAGGLTAIPYSVAYKPLLEQVAAELRAAATCTGNESLRRYLTLCAGALLSDDYVPSERAWMDLDGPIEVVVGPHETYEDGLLGTKAAFEAFVCVAQLEDSARAAKYVRKLSYLNSHLPLPDAYKRSGRGAAPLIRVADAVATGGDARKGIPTIAFNRPNDRRARGAEGTKSVLLKNVVRAKFDSIMYLVGRRVLPREEAAYVNFDAFYHFSLFHELAHSLGPGRIRVQGRETEVRAELKELYGAIEEAKADILAIYGLGLLAKEGTVPPSVVNPLPWTYLANLFCAARFGVADVRGLAAVMEINYLLYQGAVEVTPEGLFRPGMPKFARGLSALAHDVLMLEAEGSYQGAQAFVARYGRVLPPMAKLLDDIRMVPLDVDLDYTAPAAGP
jgi:hypothetical protein